MMNLVGTFGEGDFYSSGGAAVTVPVGTPRTAVVKALQTAQVGAISSIGSTNVPYLGNFLSSSAGATGAGVGGFWSGLGSVINTVLPAVFNRGGSGGTAIARTGGVGDVSTIPSGAEPGGITGGGKVAVAVGTAAAGVGGMLMHVGGVGLGGGRAARYGQPGQKGYHQIKKGPHAGMWARNRRMRVTNVRAIRRSVRRLHGFEKICRRVLAFTSPRRARGRPVFRRRRRR